MAHPAYAAIVLAGGRSERLGGIDKAMVEFAGSTLLDRVIEAVRDADDIVVVGPERPTSHAVTWREEEPVGGGPVAAFRAGMAASSTDALLLLATDLPFIAGAIPHLLEALTPSTDVAVLCDESGRANYLATAWRRSAVQARFAALDDPTGLPMRKLLDGLIVVEVPDLSGWGHDCDTPEALEIAKQRESRRNDEREHPR